MEKRTVSSIVASIVDSFSDGLEVLRQLGKGKRKKRSLGQKDPARGSRTALVKSLHNGSASVKQEYDKACSGAGNVFISGDGKMIVRASMSLSPL